MENRNAELLDKYVDILNARGTDQVSEEEKIFLDENSANAELIRLCKTARAMKNLYSAI